LPDGATKVLADTLLETMSEALYAVDCDRKITYWNAAAEQLTGYSAAEVVGTRCGHNLLNHVDETGAELCGGACPLMATVKDGQAREAHVFLHHRAGHRLAVVVRAAALRSADGAIIGAVEVFHDDSRFRALAERLDLVEHEALTDPLTGIANRRMLEDALTARENEYVRYGRGYGVLFCDVDHFKQVNDRYGYEMGDKALRAIARTLYESTRPSDTVGRWGGDEFVVVVPSADPDQAVALADRVRRLVASTRSLDGRALALTLSVGVALAQQGERGNEVVARASAATHEAKKGGGNLTRVGQLLCDLRREVPGESMRKR
jgi:diguanylate cyclase (GGDEF)-like protein/PAS domain S-box-containing protein